MKNFNDLLIEQDGEVGGITQEAISIVLRIIAGDSPSKWGLTIKEATILLCVVEFKAENLICASPADEGLQKLYERTRSLHQFYHEAACLVGELPTEAEIR